jgi:hypothetical protein
MAVSTTSCARSEYTSGEEVYNVLVTWHAEQDYKNMDLTRVEIVCKLFRKLCSINYKSVLYLEDWWKIAWSDARGDDEKEMTMRDCHYALFPGARWRPYVDAYVHCPVPPLWAM